MGSYFFLLDLAPAEVHIRKKIISLCQLKYICIFTPSQEFPSTLWEFSCIVFRTPCDLAVLFAFSRQINQQVTQLII